MTDQTADSVAIATALTQLGREFEILGDYEHAQEAFAGALDIVEASDDPASLPLITPLLTHSGRIQRRLGNLDVAEEFCLDAIEVAAALHLTDSSALVLARTELAFVHRDAGRFDDAEPIFWEALHTLQNKLGAGHPDTAAIWHALGGLSRSRGRFDDADRYFRHAVRIRMSAEAAALRPAV